MINASMLDKFKALGKAQAKFVPSWRRQRLTPQYKRRNDERPLKDVKSGINALSFEEVIAEA